MIADLGGGNQTLDMVPYKKDGHQFILIANSTRGVMKLKADNLESYPLVIDSPTVPTAPHHVAGVPYEPLRDLKGVQHLQQIDGLERAAVGQLGHERNLAPRCGGRPGCCARTGTAEPADDCVALTRKLSEHQACYELRSFFYGDDRSAAYEALR